MPTSKVTRKGQITIPQEIREALGIQEGDMVEVSLAGGTVELRRVAPWGELAGSLRDRAHLVPGGEPQLRGLSEEAWAVEAAERLGRDRSG